MYEPITRSLLAAESAARELVADCVGQGEYARVRRLADYAQSIKSLREAIENDEASRLGLREERQQMSQRERNVRTHMRGTRRPYPHFFIEGDRLVKIGQSRPDAETLYYRHETPRDIFERVVDGIRLAESKSGPWGIRELEARLAVRGMATYHIYNIVGALREAGLATQVGRGLYQVSGAVPPDAWWEFIAQLWPKDALAESEVRRSDGDE